MGKILQLDPSVVGRIAAGEVVERPASVVKELVENALDAGAARIRVDIEGAPARIVVQDDGEGMDPEDACRCFERHATSKLRTEADLSRLRTLGFRGEALAAIAAVADVELVSRPSGAERGYRVRVRAGRRLEAGPVGCGPGTRLTVQGLFDDVPARRSFLRSPVAERRACLEMTERLALSRPEVAFQVYLDGQLRLATPGDGLALSAAAAVLGPALASRLREVRAELGPVRVEGLLGPPGEHRPTRSHFWCFVNGRWVDDRGILAATCRGYETALPRGRFPVGLLYLSLEPDEVDVNVHPAKLHVRFAREGLVQAAVVRAVRQVVGGLGVDAPAPPLYVPAGGRQGVGEQGGAYGAPSGDAGTGTAFASEAGETDGIRPSPPHAGSAGREASQGRLWPAGPRVLGQLFLTYILAEWSGRLLIVDQHVAHERYIYERLRRIRQAAVPPSTQALMTPALVHLSPVASEGLEPLLGWLEQLGFQMEPFGGGAWRVRSVPAVVAGALGDPEALSRTLEQLVRQAPDLPGAGPAPAPAGPGEVAALADWEDRLLKQLACRSAVKAGEPLSPIHMEQLLAGLTELDNPYTCPHGRPVLVQVTSDELHRRFGRPARR